MAEDFRLWAGSGAGKNTIKRDWSLAFMGWMRREKKQGTGPPRRRNEMAEALDRIVEKARKHDADNGSGKLVDIPKNGRGSEGVHQAESYDDSGSGGSEIDPVKLPAKH